MFRFFCEICIKVKRVQKQPIRLGDAEAVNPLLRIGTCDKHYRTRVVRPITISINKVEAAISSTRKGKKR